MPKFETFLEYTLVQHTRDPPVDGCMYGWDGRPTGGFNEFVTCDSFTCWCSCSLRSQTTTADDSLIYGVCAAVCVHAQSVNRSWALWIRIPWPPDARFVAKLLTNPLCPQIVIPPFINLWIDIARLSHQTWPHKVPHWPSSPKSSTKPSG